MRTLVVALILIVVGVVACARTAADRQAPAQGVPAPRAPELHPDGATDCDPALLRGFDELEAATGTRIGLDGVPRVAVACTEKECTDGRACCNACEGEYVLLDDNRQVTLRGLPGCSGMDCDTVCEPFGRAPTRAYRFVGAYDHAQRVLQVETFCRR